MLPLGLSLDKQGGTGEGGRGQIVKSETIMELVTEPLASVYPERMCGTFYAADSYDT